MANTYDIGDVVRVTATFTNSSGAAADPTAILMKQKDPTPTTTTYTYLTDVALVKDSTGVYHVDVYPTIAGTWYYRFEGTGTVQAASENSFIVNPSKFY